MLYDTDLSSKTDLSNDCTDQIFDECIAFGRARQPWHLCLQLCHPHVFEWSSSVFSLVSHFWSLSPYANVLPAYISCRRVELTSQGSTENTLLSINYYEPWKDDSPVALLLLPGWFNLHFQSRNISCGERIKSMNSPLNLYISPLETTKLEGGKHIDNAALHLKSAFCWVISYLRGQVWTDFTTILQYWSYSTLGIKLHRWTGI